MSKFKVKAVKQQFAPSTSLTIGFIVCGIFFLLVLKIMNPSYFSNKILTVLALIMIVGSYLDSIRCGKWPERKAYKLTSILNSLLSSFQISKNNLHVNLENASVFLKNAEQEFSNNASVPFWDMIEKVVKELYSFNSNVIDMKRNRDRYYVNLNKTHNQDFIEHNFPILDEDKLPNPEPVLDEFQRVVYLGLSNSDFSIIFERKKAQNVMIAGTKTLVEAISNISYAIITSMNSLQVSFSSDMSKIVDEHIRRIKEVEKHLD